MMLQFNIFKNLSIKLRLIIIIMAVSFVSVLLTAFTISVIGRYSIQGNLEQELAVSASIVGDRNTAALLFNDDKQAQANLSVFSVNQNIVQACLYNQMGTLFARYAGKRFENEKCPLDLSERSNVTDSRIELMMPIVKMGDKIGYIYIESTLEQIAAYIKKQILIACTVAATALLVSYLLAINMQKTISKPILSLADTARQVSIRKDFGIRAPLVGDKEKEFNNELVTLTSSFNDMLAEIGARDHQLKQKNTELERARDIAEGANRAKSQFLANISHELRTPLNAIIGFSSILMNQLFGSLGDQKYLEYSKDINESGTHLLDIINDILDLSKAEAGKLTLHYEEVHIGKAIGKCITILSERADKGKVSIITNIPKMLPLLVVDRLRFVQIMLNIISNAVKFTEEKGRVHISVATRTVDDEVTHFVVTVEDTGIGMAKDDIEKAFQSFGQIDSGLNRKYEGTGLGLPLTKKLMDLHYGDIQIESEMGKGTVVTLVFPALPPLGVEYEPPTERGA